MDQVHGYGALPAFGQDRKLTIAVRFAVVSREGFDTHSMGTTILYRGLTAGEIASAFFDDLDPLIAKAHLEYGLPVAVTYGSNFDPYRYACLGQLLSQLALGLTEIDVTYAFVF